MKKKLALFMTMMLVMSMIPFSAFAVEDSDLIKVIGELPDVVATDKMEEIQVEIEVQEYQIYNGYVTFTLENARLANISNAVNTKIFVSGELEEGVDIRYQTPFEQSLIGGEKTFVMGLYGKEPQSKDGPMKVVVSMKLDFEGSSAGDVTLKVEDTTKTGIGNHSKVIAKQVGDEQRKMSVTVKDEKTRVGLDGGGLSSFTIRRLDRLDSVKANNEIKIKLPKNIKFDKKTGVKVNGNILTPSYNDLMTEMYITGISSADSYIDIVPVIQLEENTANYGEVNVEIEFKVNRRVVDSSSVKLGLVTDSSIDVNIREQGKNRIPEMTSSDLKTVEITITGIKDSFKRGSIIYFNTDKVDIVYGKVAVGGPKGKLLLMGESVGSKEQDLLNGVQIYKDKKIGLKILDPAIDKINLTMDITTSSTSDGRATVEITSEQFNPTKKEIAVVTSKVKVQTEMAVGQKGIEFSGRDIVIRESLASALNTGDKIYISLDKTQSGIAIDKMKIEATSGLEVSKPKLNNSVLELEILKKSYTAPGTITISGISVFSSELITTGTAKIQIKLGKDIIFEGDYVNFVGEKRLSEKTVFTLGSKTYTVSGNTKELLQAPYAKNGYTMLPVKALADSLGLTSTWDSQSKQAIFSSEGKMAVVKIGDKTMRLNGGPIPMAVAAEVVNGTTMVELRTVANVFGVDIAWDGSTKTITVTPK